MCGLLGLACGGAGAGGEGDALVLAVVVLAIVLVIVVAEDVLLDQGAGFEDCLRVSVMVKREVHIAGKGTHA